MLDHKKCLHLYHRHIYMSARFEWFSISKLYLPSIVSVLWRWLRYTMGAWKPILRLILVNDLWAFDSRNQNFYTGDAEYNWLYFHFLLFMLPASHCSCPSTQWPAGTAEQKVGTRISLCVCIKEFYYKSWSKIRKPSSSDFSCWRILQLTR